MFKAGDIVIGDLVILRSGGPAMTVVGYAENGDVHCIWMSSEPPTDVHRGQFPPETVKPY